MKNILDKILIFIEENPIFACCFLSLFFFSSIAIIRLIDIKFFGGIHIYDNAEENIFKILNKSILNKPEFSDIIQKHFTYEKIYYSDSKFRLDCLLDIYHNKLDENKQKEILDTYLQEYDKKHENDNTKKALLSVFIVLILELISFGIDRD